MSTPEHQFTEADREAMASAFREAIDIADGQVAAANICRCSQSNISQLLKKKSPCPGRFVLKLEAATGVSRYRLRPDLYPTGQSASPTDAEQFVDCEPVISGLDLPVQSNRMPLFDGRPEAA